MAGDGYLERYRRFFERRDAGTGFEFHSPGPKSEPPPSVSFTERLRWWSWDRWKRRKQILAERDRRQQEIVRLKQRPANDGAAPEPVERGPA